METFKSFVCSEHTISLLTKTREEFKPIKTTTDKHDDEKILNKIPAK